MLLLVERRARARGPVLEAVGLLHKTVGTGTALATHIGSLFGISAMKHVLQGTSSR